MVTWHTGIDWDDDGFICWDTQPGDALNKLPTPVSLALMDFHHNDLPNLLPTPVTWTGLHFQNWSNSTITQSAEMTAYGENKIRCVTGTVTNAGMVIGWDGSPLPLDNIAIDASTQYTMSFWAKGISGYTGVPMLVSIRDQDNNVISDTPVSDLTAAWQQYNVTFTTGVGDTFIAALFIKNNDATDITFDLTGTMLVKGASAPPDFNDGTTNWQASVWSQVNQRTDYGLKVVRVTTRAGQNFDGVYYGQDVQRVVDDIPVTPSTQYTLKCWVKGVSFTNGDQVRLQVFDQDMNSIATGTGVALASTWTAMTLTFTSGAGDTHIAITVQADNVAASIQYDVAGMMLIDGASAPAGFNAGDSSNADDNIAARVRDLQWRLGFAAPFDTVAAPSSAQIIVENYDKSFSPENTSHALTRSKLVAIDSDDGTMRRRHFTGMIDRIEPAPGTQGKRQAVLHATGVEQQLAEHQVHIAPGIDITADTAIADVLNQVHLRPPRLKLHWIVGIAGNSEVGQAMIVVEDEPVTLEGGQTVLAYVGDTWGDGIAALDAIRAIAETERGRFFVNRDGQLVFYNRHHTLLDTASLVTFADNMDGLDYAFGDAVVNQVEVRLIPRSVGTAGTVLWTTDQTQKIKRGESLDIVVTFRDDNDEPIGALALEALVPGNDYTANANKAGTSDDMTAFVHIALIEQSFSAALLRVRNLSAQKVFLQPGMQLRGTPLFQGNPIMVSRRDETSIAQYGLKRIAFTLPALTDIESAEQLARYELARRKDPRGTVRRMTLHDTQHTAQQLTRTLFDRITIIETQTGHNADYFIIAEAHHLQPKQARHETTWLLESADASAFWVVNTGTVGETTTPAY